MQEGLHRTKTIYPRPNVGRRLCLLQDAREASGVREASPETTGAAQPRRRRPAQKRNKVTREVSAAEDAMPCRAHILGTRSDDVKSDAKRPGREEAPGSRENWALSSSFKERGHRQVLIVSPARKLAVSDIIESCTILEEDPDSGKVLVKVCVRYRSRTVVTAAAIVDVCPAVQK